MLESIESINAIFYATNVLIRAKSVILLAKNAEPVKKKVHSILNKGAFVLTTYINAISKIYVYRLIVTTGIARVV